MNVLVVHAHPEPTSFVAALRDRAVQTLTAEGHDVVVSDLYAQGWNPVAGADDVVVRANPARLSLQAEQAHASERDGFAADVQRELERLELADLVVFTFPLWWFGLPAILKGWVDRVFVSGRTYGGGRWYSNGALSGKRAMLALTTGGPAHIYGPDGINGDMDGLLFPVHHGMFWFTGIRPVAPFIAWSAAHGGDDVRAAYLDEFSDRLRTVFDTEPIDFPGLEAYDATLRLKSAS